MPFILPRNLALCDAFFHAICHYVMHSFMKSAILSCVPPWNLPICHASFHEICHYGMHSSMKFAILPWNLPLWHPFFHEICHYGMYSSMTFAILPCILPWNLSLWHAFFHEICHSAMHSSRKYGIPSFCHSKRSLYLTCFNKTLSLQRNSFYLIGQYFAGQFYFVWKYSITKIQRVKPIWRLSETSYSSDRKCWLRRNITNFRLRLSL